jgi:two-component system sensor histidine kinase/response regulator
MGSEAQNLEIGAAESEFRAQIAALEATVTRLQEERHLFRKTFVENPMPAIAYAAQTLDILDANESAVSLYGYSREEMTKLNLMALFSPAEQRRSHDLAVELQRSINNIGTFTHISAAGQELVVSLVSFSLVIAGTDARMVMVLDETGRHMAEEALKSSEERFRELFENANDVIFLHDLRGKILAINRAGEYLTGYSRSEVLGHNFDHLIAPEARPIIHDFIRAHLGGSATQHYELPIVSKFGNRRFLEVSTRILYRRGQPVAIQGIGRDITDRKQAQQRLEESSRELQRKNEELSHALQMAREATQLKEQFLANTSHELRTPMNGIMGMVNLLLETNLNLDQREYAEAVNQCANDLLTIINDILDVSQIESGRLSLSEQPFDMRDSLQAVLRMLRLRALAKNLQLGCELDASLPEQFIGDSVRLRQVFTNLISNAIKFTSNGGVLVKLMYLPDVNRVRCEVIDSGIGVSDSVRERIFEAFVQADGSTRRRFGGTGLGLTISKQLVELMGGRIGTYNNESALGSTFWFELPLKTPSKPGDGLAAKTIAGAVIEGT